MHSIIVIIYLPMIYWYVCILALCYVILRKVQFSNNTSRDEEEEVKK